MPRNPSFRLSRLTALAAVLPMAAACQSAPTSSLGLASPPPLSPHTIIVHAAYVTTPAAKPTIVINADGTASLEQGPIAVPTKVAGLGGY